MSRALRVKGWRQFQHYKHRRPPWIKLHRKLLDDRVYLHLPDAAQALAPLIWLIASESDDGVIRSAVREIAFRVRKDEAAVETALNALIEAGFMSWEDDASTMLAPRLQHADSESESEKSRGRRKHDASTTLAPAGPWSQRLKGYTGASSMWLEEWGPRPETGRCLAPPPILFAYGWGPT